MRRCQPDRGRGRLVGHVTELAVQPAVLGLVEGLPSVNWKLYRCMSIDQLLSPVRAAARRSPSAEWARVRRSRRRHSRWTGRPGEPGDPPVQLVAGPHPAGDEPQDWAATPSVVGLLGSADQANYTASKAGLVGLARSLGPKLRSRNITAKVVAPGLVDTDMTAVPPENRKATIQAKVPLLDWSRRTRWPPPALRGISRTDGECWVVSKGSEVLVDGGRGDAIPAVP